jgi:hypothetical protein
MVWDDTGKSVHLLHESSQSQVAERHKDSNGAALPSGHGQEPPQGARECPLGGRMGDAPSGRSNGTRGSLVQQRRRWTVLQDRLDGLATPLGNAQGEEPGQGGDDDLRFPIRREGGGGTFLPSSFVVFVGGRARIASRLRETLNACAFGGRRY